MMKEEKGNRLMSSEKRKQKTVLQRVGGAAASLFFVGAVALMVFTAYSVFQFRNDPGKAFLFGYKPAIVQTGSMSPYMEQNSVVVIRQTDFTQVRPGNVITYRLGEQFITHRAVSAAGAQVIVKGDRNATPDSTPVTAQNFVGTEVWRMNWVAPVVTGFQTDPTSAALRYLALPAAGIFLVWFIVAMMIKFVKAGKQERLQLGAQEQLEVTGSSV
jgi:signal peptidase